MADEPAPRTIQSEADVAHWCREQLAWVNKRLQEAAPGGQAVYAPEDIASLQREAEILTRLIAVLEAEGY